MLEGKTSVAESVIKRIRALGGIYSIKKLPIGSHHYVISLRKDEMRQLTDRVRDLFSTICDCPDLTDTAINDGVLYAHAGDKALTFFVELYGKNADRYAYVWDMPVVDYLRRMPTHLALKRYKELLREEKVALVSLCERLEGEILNPYKRFVHALLIIEKYGSHWELYSDIHGNKSDELRTFCTEAKSLKEGFYDILEINEANGVYAYFPDVDGFALGGEDVDGEPIFEIDLTRFEFDTLFKATVKKFRKV